MMLLLLCYVAFPVVLFIAPLLLRRMKWLLTYVVLATLSITTLWIDYQPVPITDSESLAQSLVAAFLDMLLPYWTQAFAFGINLRLMEVAVTYALKVRTTSLPRALAICFATTIIVFVISYWVTGVLPYLKGPWLPDHSFFRFVEQTGVYFLLGYAALSVFVAGSPKVNWSKRYKNIYSKSGSLQ